MAAILRITDGNSGAVGIGDGKVDGVTVGVAVELVFDVGVGE